MPDVQRCPGKRCLVKYALDLDISVLDLDISVLDLDISVLDLDISVFDVLTC